MVKGSAIGVSEVDDRGGIAVDKDVAAVAEGGGLDGDGLHTSPSRSGHSAGGAVVAHHESAGGGPRGHAAGDVTDLDPGSGQRLRSHSGTAATATDGEEFPPGEPGGGVTHSGQRDLNGGTPPTAESPCPGTSDNQGDTLPGSNPLLHEKTPYCLS